MSLAEDLGNIPSIKRGQVWCRECGYTQKVDGVNATLGGGWPKHCGYTMTIDSPEEQAELKVQTGRISSDCKLAAGESPALNVPSGGG